MTVLLAVAVVAAGYLGPRPTPSPSPAPSLLAEGPTRAPATSSPSGPVPRSIDAFSGLTPVQLLPGQVVQSWLPQQITSQTPAIIGLRLFYVVQSSEVESSLIGSADDPQTLVSAARCEAINQLAAAGHELAYVVTSPAGATAQIAGCEGSAVSWSVWLLDLNGGRPRQVASGVRQPGSIDVAEFPIHLALTATAFAFDRPPATARGGAGETVEVHSIDGSLLWTSQTQTPVDDVLLGGGRLAILTQGEPSAAGLRDLWLSDATHPAPMEVAQPVGSASFSPDGSYLAWDLPPGAGGADLMYQSAVGIEALDTGRVVALNARTSTETSEPIRPDVSMTKAGPAIAWFATSPEGAVYPAFRFAGGGDGGYLLSGRAPVWMHIDGSMLVWVAESPDGWSNEAFAVELLALASDGADRPAGLPIG